MKRVAEATLPTRFGKFAVHAFVDGKEEHLALVKGEIRNRSDVLARIHSRCLTGDVFGSLRCDCRGQLEKALRLIARKGGVLIYLDQEGRGIGLANKIRAYALQERGLDTVEANRALGFEADERDYEIAGRMLKALGVRSVALLTNNMEKVNGIERLGIRVSRRIPLVARPNRYNRKYLLAKKEKMNHLIG